MSDMGATRRKFKLEFKTEAAHRVIDTGRTVAEVAAELSVVDSVLARWVRDERRRMEAVAGTSEEPLNAAERTELLRLRRQVAEQEKDLAFLGRAAAYFASSPPKQKDLRGGVRELRDHPHGSPLGGLDRRLLPLAGRPGSPAAAE
jgi:transposase